MSISYQNSITTIEGEVNDHDSFHRLLKKVPDFGVPLRSVISIKSASVSV